jgi:hypothetical protein
VERRARHLHDVSGTASILEPLGIAAADVIDDDMKVDWKTVTLLVDQVSRLVDDDVERLREIGRLMSVAPSYAPLRRLAGVIVSVRRLYDIANRYVAPASFRTCAWLRGSRAIA